MLSYPGFSDDMSWLEKVKVLNKALQSNNHYGKEETYTVKSVEPDTKTIVFSVPVSKDVIGINGTLDEGWVATMADNLTSVGIMAFLGARPSVSSTITVHALTPINPGIEIELICQMPRCIAPNPHSTAVFRDANDPERVYATVSHTKFIKDDLIAHPKKKQGAL